MVATFAARTAAGTEAYRTKAGSGHEFVKDIVTAFAKNGKGFLGGGIVSGLHQDIGHAFTRPVGFQEDG